MEFINRLDSNAGFLRTSFGPERMLGAVIYRPVFRIKDGCLVETPDVKYPIDSKPYETTLGEFAGDMPFLTGGVDLFLVGNAYQPNGYPAETLSVDLTIGSRFKRSLTVFGDRYWERRDNELVPSRPEPFVDMPLSYDFAYGGSYEVEGTEVDWAHNPDGMGVYLSEDDAELNLLPNIEDPECLIKCFEDRPEPIGVEPYPSDWGLKPRYSVDMEVDEANVENTRIKRITPRVFNHAHPKFVIPAEQSPAPGEVIEVTNVRPDGALQFTLPDMRLQAEVRLADRTYHFPLHLDQIGIDAESMAVMLSYRVVFKYAVIRMEKRSVTLVAMEALGAEAETDPRT